MFLHQSMTYIWHFLPPSYDAVFLANAETFIKSFLEFNANVVFSAEGFCWPDRWLVVSKPD